MLSFQTILPHTLELLKKLAAQPEIANLRLVGGTSLALQYGHRQSVDLDFFGSFATTQEDLLQMVQRFGSYTILNQTKNILQLTINGIKVDFVNYSCYEWIDEPIIEDGITLASPRDIAALKINAIEGRGTKKDFVDIFVLLQHFSLDEILTFYKNKYPEHSEFRALLSLTYFEDADAQPLPQMFITPSWEEMKQTIIAHVKRYQLSSNDQATVKQG